MTYDLLDGIRRDYNNKALSSNWRERSFLFYINLRLYIHYFLQTSGNARNLHEIIFFRYNNKSTLNYR